jgi:nicotinamidase/pyrazinamidase
MVTYTEATALIVVDVQNDFADPHGSLFVPGGTEVVSEANREIEAAAKAGSLVVYTQDWHPPDTPHFSKDGGVWPVHCVIDTWGAAFHPDLVVRGEVIRKGSGGEDGYSGFSVRDPTSGDVKATRLGSLLRERRIERVVVVGLATDYCVKETALDALRSGWDTTVVRRAVSAVDLEPGDGEAALNEIAEAKGTLEQ